MLSPYKRTIEPRVSQTCHTVCHLRKHSSLCRDRRSNPQRRSTLFSSRRRRSLIADRTGSRTWADCLLYSIMFFAHGAKGKPSSGSNLSKENENKLPLSSVMNIELMPILGHWSKTERRLEVDFIGSNKIHLLSLIWKYNMSYIKSQMVKLRLKLSTSKLSFTHKLCKGDAELDDVIWLIQINDELWHRDTLSSLDSQRGHQLIALFPSVLVTASFISVSPSASAEVQHVAFTLSLFLPFNVPRRVWLLHGASVFDTSTPPTHSDWKTDLFPDVQFHHLC